ncbi:hypothetical protein [Prauserella endophytica]|uniref:hypothetical protein n=1 Tax=Prauserella endophytica TaxID=1592324 RepID=UPI00197DFE95|nr:hypothetical protein [Prauserella endophytica]
MAFRHGKVELVDGVLVSSGQFDERDLQTAQGAYPGRQVILKEGGGIEIHPASATRPRSIYETYLERLRQRGANRDK